MPPKLHTLKEAASILHISPSTLRKRIEAKEIGYIKPGRSYFINDSQIQAYLDKSTIAPNPLPDPLSVVRKNAIIRLKGESASMSKSKTRYNYGRGIASIYVRKTKKGQDRFYLGIYDENGKLDRKVIKGASSIEQAERVLFTKIEEVFNKRHGLKMKKEITLKEFAPEYIETYAKVKKKSWKSDQKYLKNHLLSAFGHFKLTEITRHHVQKFMAQKLAKGLDGSSINKYYRVLRRMYNLAGEWGYAVSENPVKNSDFFDETKNRRLRELLPEEEKALFAEAKPHLRAIMQYALLTGCRTQEILGLQKRDLDFERKSITIRPEINKTGKLNVIPMPAQLETFLEQHISMNGTNDYVFTYSGKPLTSISRAFENARKRAGITNLQFRDLRKTCAIRLHRAKVDPLIISRAILRHSSFKTSEQFYIHANIDDMRNALDEVKTDTFTDTREK